MAKGSHQTRGGWEPKVCCYCGGKVTTSRGPAAQFDYDHRTKTARAWHIACAPRKLVLTWR